MQPAIKKRIAGTMSANLFGQLVTIGTQLINVPLFLSVWGEDLYGEWLVVSALPLLVGQSCSGFAAAGGTEMLVRGRDDRGVSLGIFHTSTFITILICTGILAAACLAAAMNLGAIFGFKQLSHREINVLLVLFAAQVALHIAMGLVVAGFRAAEMFARGFMWQHMTRIGAFTGGAFALLAGHPPVTVALLMLAGQAILMAISIGAMSSRVPWLTWGLTHRSREEFHRLLKPSLADTTYPLSLALRAQAMVVVLGVVASPVDAALFASLRTLTSLVIQATRIIYTAVQQEMSVAYGNAQIDLFRTMHLKLLTLTFRISLVLALPMLIFAHPIHRTWTRGQLPYSASAMTLLLCGGIAANIALVNLSALRAVNAHGGVAMVMLAANMLAAAIGLPVVAYLGLFGAAAIVLVADISVLLYSMQAAARATGTNAIFLVRAMIFGSPRASYLARVN